MLLQHVRWPIDRANVYADKLGVALLTQLGGAADQHFARHGSADRDYDTPAPLSGSTRVSARLASAHRLQRATRDAPSARPGPRELGRRALPCRSVSPSPAEFSRATPISTTATVPHTSLDQVACSPEVSGDLVAPPAFKADPGIVHRAGQSAKAQVSGYFWCRRVPSRTSGSPRVRGVFAECRSSGVEDRKSRRQETRSRCRDMGPQASQNVVVIAPSCPSRVRPGSPRRCRCRGCFAGGLR
jgi:hypothetical protein